MNTTETVTRFKRCLGIMSNSRAGWDFDLPPAQKAKENQEEKSALAEARAIWAQSPEMHEALRTAFDEARPLATMREIESGGAS